MTKKTIDAVDDKDNIDNDIDTVDVKLSEPDDDGLIPVIVKVDGVAVKGVRKKIGETVKVSLNHYECNKDRFERV